MIKAIFKTKDNKYITKDTETDKLLTVFGVTDEMFEASDKVAVNGNKYLVKPVVKKVSKAGREYYQVVNEE